MTLGRLKTLGILNAKNLVGWRSDRKIVVLSVDDYGNVRLESRAARRRMDRQGLKIYSRFDALDTLETRRDLEALYEVLTSVSDGEGRPAVVTPFAVPCNINFEMMAETGYVNYFFEELPDTFQKLSESDPDAYGGAWELWKEGIELGLMVPQFHGREHLNVRMLEEKLAERDHEVLTALKNRSFTSISSNSRPVSPLAAFDFWKFDENEEFIGIIEDGCRRFENVFGYRATNFTPPSFTAHPVLNDTLRRQGIEWIDAAIMMKEHQGEGRYKRKFNYTGKVTAGGLHVMVRNVVFEPTSNRAIDWPSYGLRQVEAAFRLRRPAIISSHRVNYCGHIDEENRKSGLIALENLLHGITERWPDVLFMAANELGALILDGKTITQTELLN